MDIPQLYHEGILWIGGTTGMPDPTLHIHAGLAILVLVRLLTRRSLGTFIPFWFVVAAELANEAMDYLSYGLLLGDALADIGNTLFWPFVISLAVRLRPLLGTDERPAPGTNALYSTSED
jgi:hypothetical protein